MKEITLIVKYSVKNGMVNDFLTALKNEGFPQIVQNENGCIKYDYFVPSFGKSNEVLLIEKWQSEKLQKEHRDKENTAPFQKALNDLMLVLLLQTKIKNHITEQSKRNIPMNLCNRQNPFRQDFQDIGIEYEQQHAIYRKNKIAQDFFQSGHIRYLLFSVRQKAQEYLPAHHKDKKEFQDGIPSGRQYEQQDGKSILAKLQHPDQK